MEGAWDTRGISYQSIKIQVKCINVDFENHVIYTDYPFLIDNTNNRIRSTHKQATLYHVIMLRDIVNWNQQITAVIF